MNEVHPKVSPGHLSRDAYLYVRQSTVRQVSENTESTRRQYALRETAVALGWPADRVVVIDTDLGESGADRDREGFQRLVADVGMGHAGIVLGLEVSRLARNSIDWHRLLEICALSDTLILDEDGIYDPADFNDRLLLGLKGTMSEAELHMLRARLRGGLMNQARRGALKLMLPVGLVYDPLDRVVLDPDAQVRRSIRMLFDTFARTGSAGGRRCDASATRGSTSPDAPTEERRRASSAGSRPRTRMSLVCCTIRAMREPTPTGAAAGGAARTAASGQSVCPSGSGRSCCATRIPATSPGIASRPISGSCVTTCQPAGAGVRPARGRHFCRASRYAVCAVAG